ncbi:MAG: hypothetical protein HYU52_05155 [Acidobacteria bacterium]|nr:hypothetical protein [Acidobacteriota bacterium]
MRAKIYAVALALMLTAGLTPVAEAHSPSLFERLQSAHERHVRHLSPPSVRNHLRAAHERHLRLLSPPRHHLRIDSRPNVRYRTVYRATPRVYTYRSSYAPSRVYWVAPRYVWVDGRRAYVPGHWSDRSVVVLGVHYR